MNSRNLLKTKATKAEIVGLLPIVKEFLEKKIKKANAPPSFYFSNPSIRDGFFLNLRFKCSTA